MILSLTWRLWLAAMLVAAAALLLTGLAAGRAYERAVEQIRVERLEIALHGVAAVIEKQLDVGARLDALAGPQFSLDGLVAPEGGVLSLGLLTLDGGGVRILLEAGDPLSVPARGRIVAGLRDGAISHAPWRQAGRLVVARAIHGADGALLGALAAQGDGRPPAWPLQTGLTAALASWVLFGLFAALTLRWRFAPVAARLTVLRDAFDQIGVTRDPPAPPAPGHAAWETERQAAKAVRELGLGAASVALATLYLGGQAAEEPAGRQTAGVEEG